MRLIATEKLKEAREAKGTQEEFVEVIKLYRPKLTRSAYATYELGTRTISIEMAKTIAHLLNKPLYKLFRVKE